MASMPQPNTPEFAILEQMNDFTSSVANGIAACVQSANLATQALVCVTTGLRSAKQLCEADRAAVLQYHQLSEDEDALPDVTMCYDCAGARTLIREKVHCCHACGKRSAKMMCCTKCKHTSYCDRACQSADWAEHKTLCRTISNIFSSEFGSEKQSRRVFAFKAFMQPTLQEFHRPHRVKFWLGVLIKNMDAADPLTAKVVMQQLVWFVFHFLGAAVPKSLSKALVDGNARFKRRALKKQRGWQWAPQIPAAMREMVSVDLIGLSDSLTWLTLTDERLKPLLDREAVQKFSGLQGDMLDLIKAQLLSSVLQLSVNTTNANGPWDATPALATYCAVRGAGLLTTPLGALVEQDACDTVIGQMLSEEPFEKRTKYLLLGARAAVSAELAPPGSSTLVDVASVARDGLPANQRIGNEYQAFGLTQLNQVHSTAVKLWRSHARDGAPFLKVITQHATSGHGGSAWLQQLGNASIAAPVVDENTLQQLRALGGAFARLLKTRNKQPERFLRRQKRTWLCMSLARSGDAARFGEQRTQAELFAAATAGRDAAAVRRQLNLPSMP